MPEPKVLLTPTFGEFLVSQLACYESQNAYSWLCF